MSSSGADERPEVSPDPDSAQKKRKRSAKEPDEELEIDVNLPEPPSKKAKRKEKKAKDKKLREPSNGDTISQDKTQTTPANQTRSEHGIWIGNLPFTVTKEDLRAFLNTEGEIKERDIVRLHLPTSTTAKGTPAQNKGFAYIDFTTGDILDNALQLSEKLLHGRRVLIKNAKNFEGRPVQKRTGDANGEAKDSVKKEPTKRIFVGNLSFDVTREELSEHFSPAGVVEDVFLATFEDSGKCKGFGWVRFAEVEAAEAAVKGYVYKDLGQDEGEDDESADEQDVGSEKKRPKKKPKRQKRWINRLHGRELRCEFAEDAQTRYKKRFRKGGEGRENGATLHAGATRASPDYTPIGEQNQTQPASTTRESKSSQPKQKPKVGKDERREERWKRHEKLDARSIAPGKALANTQRVSGAIVAGTGSKISFD